MSHSRDHDRYADIDGVRFEPESGELTGPDGRKARLAPQPARVLTLLLGEPGRLVTRETIASDLWPHGSVEIDQGIGYAVREVRKAIESVGGDPNLLETIPRRGFRVRVAGGEDNPVTGAGAAAVRRPVPRRIVAGLLVVAVLGFGAWLGATRTAGPPSEPPVLAVFEHASEGPDARAFAGALGTTLTTRLTQDFTGRLGVIGPTGTGALSGPDDTEGIRDRLGACLILSGGVRDLSDSSVAVFTQLVRSTDRVHVWAATDTVERVGGHDEVAVRVLAGVEGVLADCGG